MSMSTPTLFLLKRNRKMKITLANLAQATEQDVFDQVAKHMLAQMQRSENGAQCRYRSGHLKCAAGCLISDEEYSHSMEGSGWLGLVLCDVVPDTHEDLISILQYIHDSQEVCGWEEELKGLAVSRGLEFKGG